MEMKLSHIGIAVESLEQAVEIYGETLGFELKESVQMSDEGMRIAIMNCGNTQIELIEPTSDDTPVGKFLKKRGSGLHHLCFSVPKLERVLKVLEGKGLRAIAPPSVGAEGERVVFFNPKETMGVLIEICEEGVE
ncbi:hypothetical protein AMJ40_04385 [candidate division TA06 bacterium DG_26]|uniref:VOC domain-containing protein n=1 Tax=candidate division TA06 bacterium DG_26 TaxID=1703771 RepID=A0A0S7WIE7_UNCT6|nr:MAG: hypothetical protein AMJ40_04385 [candidate division TA06 bacterium DG_26]